MGTFGAPITMETVKGLYWYAGRQITQVDLAREAMRYIQSNNKNLDAEQYAWDLKEQFGDGVSTMVLVYNATGTSLTLQGGRDWLGSHYKVPVPGSLQNGQWIAFLHAKGGGANGSKAARVFRGQDSTGRIRDFAVAWSIPWGVNTDTRAYTEVADANYFNSRWSTVETRLNSARRITHAKDVRCASTISIGGTTTSICMAVLQHQFSPLPEEL